MRPDVRHDSRVNLDIIVVELNDHQTSDVKKWFLGVQGQIASTTLGLFVAHTTPEQIPELVPCKAPERDYGTVSRAAVVGAIEYDDLVLNVTSHAAPNSAFKVAARVEVVPPNASG